MSRNLIWKKINQCCSGKKNTKIYTRTIDAGREKSSQEISEWNRWEKGRCLMEGWRCEGEAHIHQRRRMMMVGCTRSERGMMTESLTLTNWQKKRFSFLSQPARLTEWRGRWENGWNESDQKRLEGKRQIRRRRSCFSNWEEGQKGGRRKGQKGRKHLYQHVDGEWTHTIFKN